MKEKLYWFLVEHEWIIFKDLYFRLREFLS
jgi:hypothetical protein